MTRAPRYTGAASSARASAAARGASKKAGTRPEMLLRRALWGQGLRYRVNRRDLPGVPDIVFPGRRVVVFVDGDFWHGKDWRSLKSKLAEGHNPDYWTRKISANMDRDRDHEARLHAAGWLVLRFWESDVRSNTQLVVNQILRAFSGTNSGRSGDS